MAEFLQLNPQLKGIGFTSQRTRNRMVERLIQQGITDGRVLEALRHLPRHLFLDEALAHRAYEDTALPIGLGQTLSQPYIVARMTELLLEVQPRKVLEIGTGSGFQCALLACLVPEVWSVERLDPLLQKARQRLRNLQLHNARIKHADGNFGLPDLAPFDAILVTAAPRELPEGLLEQLAEGGRLILPVGDREQMLSLFDKKEGRILRQDIEPVRFVPLLPGAEK
ncbi:protein-L-isoaspartate(D-aspartate) O-methyltransferase [Marinospirillum alkaliphilum]|uniref:Protein-L-isoaspartate O-methyltransferase n=1 Tax=Marinospirillum alkaliphilum DSM 21637 TaxID=1122209 RepID=A0A1K1V9N2_9GAMM|nr:protein-L-isoaspartate(D-aspartate) O-methyltransferase [Marinospirillum alkaliphilum]SFX21783.1 protein-L-isoaspartate(D-aspartate) O-methyltransferase [Marinospirillum alkaliphilum DSM 21637]